MPGAEDDIARLEAALARTQERLGRLERKQTVSQSPPLSPDAAPMASPTLARERAEEKFAARLETALAESRDEAWAKDTQEAVSSAIRGSTPNGTAPRVNDLSCHKRVCQMEVTLSSLQDRNDFSVMFPLQMSSLDIDGVQFQPGQQLTDGTYPLGVLIFRRGSQIMLTSADYE
ncbi:MAG: hypothetical protein WBV96_25385 [Polyangia bacterium]